jgi:predicted nucleic acid-binding protein
MEQLVAQRRAFFTSNFIVAELHALLLTRMNRATAKVALDQLDASRATTVIRVSRRDERRAREIIDQYEDKDFSYTDTTSFAIMERLHISEAFTLDRNFAQYGFTLLPPATPV